MREIKFRVWHSKRKAFLSINEDLDYLISPSEAGFILIDNGDTVSSNDLIWQQFTGLKDKNGKEIYEGDIIKLIDDVGDEIIVVCEYGTVQREIYGQTLNLCDITGFYFRKDGRATFPIVNNYAGKHDLELFEVIGNIYENPELLGKDEEPRSGGMKNKNENIKK